MRSSQDPTCQSLGNKHRKGLDWGGDVSMEIQETWACLDNPPEMRDKLLHFDTCTMKKEAQYLVGLF